MKNNAGPLRRWWSHCSRVSLSTYSLIQDLPVVLLLAVQGMGVFGLTRTDLALVDIVAGNAHGSIDKPDLGSNAYQLDSHIAARLPKYLSTTPGLLVQNEGGYDVIKHYDISGQRQERHLDSEAKDSS